MTPPVWLIRGWRNNSWWLVLFTPLSWIYLALLTINTKRMYWRAIEVPARVIVVGNLSLGGTGKTSFVGWLAAQLASVASAKEVAIVSKGYGRTQSHTTPIKVPTDGVAKGLAKQFGDEPVMLAAMLPEIAVWVCDSRRDAIISAKTRWVICDDGLQDYTFYPRFECGLIDPSQGNGHIFPRGILREKIARLKKCNLVVQQGGDELMEPAIGKFEVQITGFSNLISNQQLGIEQAQQQWAGEELHLCCGLANNQRVFDQVDHTGIIAHKHPFPDHHPFSQNDIQHQGIVLLTAKDASKCTHFATPHCWQINTKVVVSSKLTKTILNRLDKFAYCQTD